MTTLAANIIDKLSGLNEHSLFDPRAVLGWRNPLPHWLWAMIILAALLLSLWSYHRLLGNRFARIALAALRGLILLAIVALLAGPMLVIPREKVDQDYLLVLVDTSLSMTIKDMPGATKDAPMISREEAIYRAMSAHKDLFGPDQLGKERHILVLGFDSDAYPIDAPYNPANKPRELTGQSTEIRTAIEQAVQRVAGHPISGIVLLTDGRTTQDTGPVLVQRLNSQAISVFPVQLGMPNAGVDLVAGPVESPPKAFVKDDVPVMFYWDHYPADVHIDPARVHFKLIDTQTGKELDNKSPTDDNPAHPTRLSFQSDVVGQHKLRVQIDYDPPPGEPPELIKENNTRDLAVELVDQKLNVLYVEGYPRWEYRYLKNLLVREKSLSSKTFLLSADRAFTQESSVGVDSLGRLPQTAEEFRPIDVIIIGDVPSDYFSPEQLRMIQDQVSNEGTGLLWIGGAYRTPTSYDATALSGLLPMLHPGSVETISPQLTPFAVHPTPLADALNVLRLHGSAGDPDENALWPAKLPKLFWAQQLGDLKPAAEVLADATPETATTSAESKIPLVVRMHYGAGQSLYVATDDTWRWRYGRGELYFEQFWTQLIRMLGRNRIQQDRTRVRLEVSQRRADFDQTVMVKLVVNDPMLASQPMTGLTVEVSKLDDPKHTVLEKIDLLPKPNANGSTPDLSTDAGATRQFEGQWRPHTAGRLELRLAGPGVTELDVKAGIEVFRPDDELRQPAPDVQRLVQLAQDTNGKVVPLDKLDELAKLVPNRPNRTPDDIQEPLWNSYLALILVIGLLTVEWIGRKIVKLS